MEAYGLFQNPRAQEGAINCCLSPVDGADTGDSVIVTNAFCQEPVPDLPSKHAGNKCIQTCLDVTLPW